MNLDAARAERERAASNEGAVYARNAEIRSRFSHVLESPNTAYAEARYRRLLADAARGRRVLDFGCGAGHLGRTLLGLGASHVHGIDISDAFIEEARRTAQGEPRLTYETADAATFAGGPFDLICGHAILHHLDWRPVLLRLYRDVLARGGTMMFYEPLGENIGLRLYWRLFPNAHTADERPFRRADVAWFRRTFPGFSFHVTNYASFYLGVVSSLILPCADNALLRAADRLDRRLEQAPLLQPAFRYGLFMVRKGAD